MAIAGEIVFLAIWLYQGFRSFEYALPRMFSHVAFCWRTQDQQEIDYIEERDGKMWAVKMKWSSKAKPAFSKTFTQAYPEHELRCINRENYFEWLTGK